MRDRSSSKSGLDKSMVKGGAGPHSWGSPADEFDNVRAGEFDATTDQYDEADEERDTVHFDTTTGTIVGSFPPSSSESDTASVVDDKSPTRDRSNSTMSTGSAGVTDSERATARNFRTASFNGNRTDIDLAAIARTSHAVSTSPPAPTVFRKSTTGV